MVSSILYDDSIDFRAGEVGVHCPLVGCGGWDVGGDCSCEFGAAAGNADVDVANAVGDVGDG